MENEKNNENEAILDIMADCANLYRFLYQRGLLSMMLCDSKESGIHLTKKGFLRYFPEYEIVTYSAEGGKVGHMGRAHHNGEQFFCLLDNETLEEMEAYS